MKITSLTVTKTNKVVLDEHGFHYMDVDVEVRGGLFNLFTKRIEGVELVRFPGVGWREFDWGAFVPDNNNCNKIIREYKEGKQ